MKNLTPLKQVFLLLVLFAGFTGRAEEKDERCGSPYFYINSTEPNVDKLPLKHTEATVNIAGVIADVKVKQVYVNEGESAIEAIYVFPGSTRAAVYGMKMTIGERVLDAKIQKKEEARRTYETAKSEGKTTSLLEQHRPNVFQMNVANIMPGDSIVVELSYTEMLIPEEGEYEFVYPTVVGPRYSDTPAEELTASEKWVGNPYQKEGEAPLYTYNMTAYINAGIPIQKAVCNTHEVDINFKGPDMAEIKLKESEKSGGNRDFIVKYQLAGAQLQSGVLVYEGQEENFFMAMVQPPKRVKPENIPGREYIFIVDVSGSMNGFPLNISKSLLKDLIGSLRPTDKFNVMLFASANTVMSPTSLPASKENIKKALDVIDRQRGGGGTQLLPALKNALKLPRSEGYSRSVVIATDGYVTVEKEAMDLIRGNLGEANFFSFGIGSSVNRYIIEGMARVGMGEPFVITDSKFAKGQADKFRKYIESPVLTDIGIDYDGFQAYATDPSSVPDVLAERPIVITGKFKGKAQGKIKVKGVTGEGKEYETVLDLSKAKRAKENTALKYLWARNRIQLLDDYKQFGGGQEMIDEVTELGLKYNLLTAYTSFVAVDNVVRNQGGQQESVTQPLPLPQGVSDLAVSANNGYTSYNYNQSGGSGAKYKVRRSSSYAATATPSYGAGVPSPAKKLEASGAIRISDSMSIADSDAELEEMSLEAEAKSMNEQLAAEEKRKAEAKVEKELAEFKKYAEREEQERQSKVYEILEAEKLPEYVGGDAKMIEFIKANLKYPESEKNNAIEGIVYISFVVDENGKLTDIEVARSVSKGLDEEALRVVKLMPNWLPGIVKGKAAKVKMILPFKFALDK